MGLSEDGSRGGRGGSGGGRGLSTILEGETDRGRGEQMGEGGGIWIVEARREG